MSEETAAARLNGEGADFGQIDPEQFAALMTQVSDEQLAEAMSSPARRQILDEIFGRMAEHAQPQKLQGVDAVVHFKILDRPDGGYDHYEVVIEGGTVKVNHEPEREPRVTLKIGPVPFLRLVSGSAAGPMLFMSGKLKIEGDLMFASQMTSFFRIPRAG